MLLNKTFERFKDRTEDEVDASALIGDYGTAIYSALPQQANAYATKHPGSKRPHGAHKRKGRKTHQKHGKRK